MEKIKESTSITIVTDTRTIERLLKPIISEINDHENTKKMLIKFGGFHFLFFIS